MVCGSGATFVTDYDVDYDADNAAAEDAYKNADANYYHKFYDNSEHDIRYVMSNN